LKLRSIVFGLTSTIRPPHVSVFSTWGLLTTIPVPCGARHGKETRCNSHRSTHRQPPYLRTDPIVTQLAVSTAVTLLHPSMFPLLQPPFSSPSTPSSMSTPSFPSTQEPHHKNNYSHPSKIAKPKVQCPPKAKNVVCNNAFPPRGD